LPPWGYPPRKVRVRAAVVAAGAVEEPAYKAAVAEGAAREYKAVGAVESERKAGAEEAPESKAAEVEHACKEAEAVAPGCRGAALKARREPVAERASRGVAAQAHVRLPAMPMCEPLRLVVALA
jgi:hypothetical protein